jgi:hypothetical protein
MSKKDDVARRIDLYCYSEKERADLAERAKKAKATTSG